MEIISLGQFPGTFVTFDIPHQVTFRKDGVTFCAIVTSEAACFLMPAPALCVLGF